MSKWLFQERLTNWTVWAFGYRNTYGRGWQPDTRSIYFGPFEWIFMRG